MNNAKEEVQKLVLAIDPAPRGFGYALFEGPQNPLDWGITEVRILKNITSLKKIKELVTFYQPDVLVLEDCAGDKSRRCKRVQKLIAKTEEFSISQKIQVVKYSRNRIQEVFSMFHAKTKYQISRKICEWLPEFSPRIPPKRKVWMSEDPRMSIFDAASLVLTYYYLEE